MFFQKITNQKSQIPNSTPNAPICRFFTLEAVLISFEYFAVDVLEHPDGMPVGRLSFVLPNGHAYGM